MPLTSKGSSIMTAMTQQYGADKGKRVFYASINKGRIKGVEKGGTEARARRRLKGKEDK